MNPQDMGVNTQVSGQGSVTINPYANPSTAPGAQGPGGNMSVTTAAMWIIGSSMVGLVVIGYIFRKGVRVKA